MLLELNKLDPDEWKRYQKKVIIGVTVDSVDSKPLEFEKYLEKLEFPQKDLRAGDTYGTGTFKLQREDYKSKFPKGDKA